LNGLPLYLCSSVRSSLSDILFSDIVYPDSLTPSILSIVITSISGPCSPFGVWEVTLHCVYMSKWLLSSIIHPVCCCNKYLYTAGHVPPSSLGVLSVQSILYVIWTCAYQKQSLSLLNCFRPECRKCSPLPTLGSFQLMFVHTGLLSISILLCINPKRALMNITIWSSSRRSTTSIASSLSPKLRERNPLASRPLTR